MLHINSYKKVDLTIRTINFNDENDFTSYWFLFNAIYLSFSRLNQGNETQNRLDLILDSRLKNVDGRISHLEDMMAGLLDKVEGKTNYY